MDPILIVWENECDTERLKTTFREAGLTSESTSSLTTGCDAAKSGRFHVVFSTSFAAEGSWKRLIEVPNDCSLGFEIILLVRTFDLNQWAEALQVGAFDVLDVLCDLPRAGATAKRALGTAYLKRFRPRPEQVIA